MPPVPVLDLEALREVAHEARIDERLAGLVQAGFVAERPDEDLETFAEGVVAEVGEPGLRGCRRDEIVVSRHTFLPRERAPSIGPGDAADAAASALVGARYGPICNGRRRAGDLRDCQQSANDGGSNEAAVVCRSGGGLDGAVRAGKCGGRRAQGPEAEGAEAERDDHDRRRRGVAERACTGDRERCVQRSGHRQPHVAHRRQVDPRPRRAHVRRGHRDREGLRRALVEARQDDLRQAGEGEGRLEDRARHGRLRAHQGPRSLQGDRVDPGRGRDRRLRLQCADGHHHGRRDRQGQGLATVPHTYFGSAPPI